MSSVVICALQQPDETLLLCLSNCYRSKINRSENRCAGLNWLSCHKCLEMGILVDCCGAEPGTSDSHLFRNSVTCPRQHKKFVTELQLYPKP